MKVWKALGVAGLTGVVATGVIIARNERRRTQMTPEEIRARLQQRHAAAAAEEPTVPDTAPTAAAARWRRGLRRGLHRRT